MLLEELLETYSSWIWSVARAMCNTYRLPPEDGEDLFAAARLRLCQHYSKIDFQHPAHDAYIKSLIANTCRTELGKILKHTHISLDAQPPDSDETWADRLPDMRTPAAECVPMQLVADAAMHGMDNPSHRRMVRMHMAGANNREIAERVRHKNGRAYTHQTVSIIIGRWKRSARRMARRVA
jgi:DNA-directed RNA polymerase specialized sigma24 family protein